MGRRKNIDNISLPMYVQPHHGGYVYRPPTGPYKGKKIPLGKPLSAAMKKFAEIQKDASVLMNLNDCNHITRLFNSCKNNARVRGIDFSLTKADVAELLLRAGGSCEVSNVPFNYFIVVLQLAEL